LADGFGFPAQKANDRLLAGLKTHSQEELNGHGRYLPLLPPNRNH
jgi:hypothetical protein